MCKDTLYQECVCGVGVRGVLKYINKQDMQKQRDAQIPPGSRNMNNEMPLHWACWQKLRLRFAGGRTPLRKSEVRQVILEGCLAGHREDTCDSKRNKTSHAVTSSVACNEILTSHRPLGIWLHGSRVSRTVPACWGPPGPLRLTQPNPGSPTRAGAGRWGSGHVVPRRCNSRLWALSGPGLPRLPPLPHDDPAADARCTAARYAPSVPLRLLLSRTARPQSLASFLLTSVLAGLATTAFCGGPVLSSSFLCVPCPGTDADPTGEPARLGGGGLLGWVVLEKSELNPISAPLPQVALDAPGWGRL